MDFHTLSRRDLQALCKKNHIPANVTNVAMANALQALQMVEGIEELLQSPKTIQRTAGSHKTAGPAEDQASSVPRSRRVTARTPAALNLVDEEEKKKDVAETPKVPNTRRRAGQKDEGNEIVETMRKSTRTSVVRGVEAQKEEKVVGVTTGRRTRGAVKKEVDLMSGGVKRSSRARGITMASLAKEELEEGKVETGEVVVETTEEKVDDKAEELEEQKVGDKAEEQEEEQVDDTAEEQEKVDDKADEVEEEKVETHEERDHNKAEEQEEEKVDKVDDKAEEQEEEKVDKVDDKAEEQEKFVDKAGEQEEEEEKVDDKAKQVEDKAAGARDIVDQQNVICYEKMAVETKYEEMTNDVAEKETNDIMEEGEIKSSDQTYYHDLIMSEDRDFVDQMSDLQSEEMVVEASKEDKLDDKAEQEEEEIDVQVEHEKEETDDQADEKPEEEIRDVQVELEEEKIDYQAGEKLEDKQEQEEEQIDDQIGEKLEDKQEQVELEEEKINYQAGEKLEDKQEQEEEQIDDQIEQEEEREMEDTVEEEIKSLEGNTCNDLIMSVDQESVDIKYEEMAAVMAMQEEKLEEEENEMDDIVEEEFQSLENSSAIVISHVEEREECSEFVEEAAENSPILCLITSEHVVVEESGKESGNIQIGELIDNLSDLNLSLKEDMRDLITSDQTSRNEEDENVERSSGDENETGNIQIGELVDNLSDLNLGFKEETKAGDDGVPRGENNNKENDWVGKSKAQKNNYEDMSLRKLKAAYKEVVVAMNKGEEKRAALKIIDENCS